MLCESETDPEKKELLDLTYQSAKEFLELLNNIIEFSRNEVEGSALMHKKFNFKELVISLATMEKAAAVAKKIDLIAAYSDELPDIFLGDPNRIKRLILSLMDNAIKFTHQGQITIQVLLAKRMDEKSFIVQIIVEYTGIGIAEDQQQYVYEKFFRVHPANHNTYTGAGLGLYTVKQILDELEGEIEVKSALGKGTKFICTLPLRKPLLG
jgi:signal transduction histidine kinase